MALEQIGVEAVVEGLSSFKRGLKQINDGVEKTGKSAKKATPNINQMFGSFLKSGVAIGAIAAVGQAVVQFGRESTEEFKVFERQVAEVFTLLPDLTTQATESMKADILSFSADVGRTTDETVPALYQAISAGVPPENVFDFLQVASDAARGGVTDLETAVDGITSVVNAYGDEIISAAEASDVMFTAVRLGKTNFEQLSASLFNVIPTAASLGISFEDVAASLAALTAQGTPTSVATTQLRQAFVEASKTGSKLDKALRELTGKGFAELIASGKTTQEIFLALRQATPEQEFRDLFGSVEASNAVLGVTSETAQGVISDFGTLEDVLGGTIEAAATMADTLEVVEQRSAAMTESLKIQVGESLEPTTKAWLDLKIAVVEFEIESFKMKNQVEESSEALKEMGLTGVSLQKALGAIGEGTILFRDSLVDAETMAIRTEAAVQVLGQGFEGSADALAQATFAQVLSNEAIAKGGVAAESYDQALRKVSLTAEEVAAVQVVLAETTDNVTRTTLARVDQDRRRIALANDIINSDEETVITSEMVIEVEERREEQARELADAEKAALEQLRALDAQLGEHFITSLLAGESTESLQTQMFNTAQAAGAGAVELAILAAATGNYTTAQIEAAFQSALMAANIDVLVQSMIAGNITANEATIALKTLESGTTATANEAIILAQQLESASVAMDTLTGEAIDASGAAIDLEADIKETNAQLDAMSGAAIDAATNLDKIPREVKTTIRISVEGDAIPDLPGKGRAAAAFQGGGFTGRGPRNEFAGLTHFEEIVLPESVLNKGVEEILGFVDVNLPGGIPNLGSSGATAQPSVIRPMANNTNINKEVNLSFPNAQISNDMDMQMLGDFIVQRVAEAI